MKIGVFFWGFKDLGLVADCAKIIKDKHDVKDFYVQISVNQKTISLLDVFPEEIIRSEIDDFNILYKWLIKNHKKNIIVVMDFWSLLTIKDFSNRIDILKKIFNEPFSFLLCCPKKYYEYYTGIYDKVLLNIAEKTQDYFKNLYILNDVSLNCLSNMFLLTFPPMLSLLNELCRQEFFSIKKISVFKFIPSLINDYPSQYLSKQGFLNGLNEKIGEIISTFQGAKNLGQKQIIFETTLVSDSLNIFYKNHTNIKKRFDKRVLILSSIERFYKLNTKEDTKFLQWLIYLSILECKEEVMQVSNLKQKKFYIQSKNIFSNIPL